MQIEISSDADEAAGRAASLVFEAAQTVLGQKEHFTVAFSGGSTAPKLLNALARLPLPWERIQVYQVDERIAPPGDKARNLNALLEMSSPRGPLPTDNLHPMPVEMTPPEEAADAYEHRLQEQIGRPPVFDLVHLGLGADGHTASLVPDDPVLEVMSRDVAVSQTYQGFRRLTLTYPVLNRARRLVFLVTGAGKREALARLLAHDKSIPAGRLELDSAHIIVDEAAMPEVMAAGS